MALTEWAERIARSALKMEPIVYGPWLGSMRSVSADQVPREYATTGLDFLYIPRSGTWKRRQGTTIKFDTVAVAPNVTTGLLPALWTGRVRQIDEFFSDSITDDIPTVCGLVTKETMASGLDDGRFSNFWLRDQVNSVNYTFGAEYDLGAYASIGLTPSHRVVPLWYESGAGGITRGVSEFDRRFFFSGSRRFQKVGKQIYFPSALGTPSRTTGEHAYSTPIVATATSVVGDWFPNSGAAALHTYIDESVPSDTDYIYTPCNAGAGQAAFQLTIPTPATIPGITPGLALRMHYRRTGTTVAPGLDVLVYKSDAPLAAPISISLTSVPITTNWQTANLRLSDAQIAALGDWTNLEFYGQWTGSGGAAGSQMQISWLGFVRDAPLRLIPSGPLPPTHAGTITKGNLISTGTVSAIVPTGDVAVGTWTNQAGGGASLYASIDETTTDDTDYIKNALNAASTYKASLPTPTPVPSSTNDLVTMTVRHSRTTLATGSITLQLKDTGGTTYATNTTGLGPEDAYIDLSYTLTGAEVAAITAADATWANVEMWVSTSSSYADEARISRMYLTVTPIASTLGGWTGSDRSYYSVAYRFEDGSIWMPCTPRAPQSSGITSGFNLFTVDLVNSAAHYDKIIWSNIPIGPNGTISRLLLRTNKIDSTVDDNLTLNPYDMRLVWEIQDNTTTTYDDYFADDEALTLDPDSSFIRWDHMMPPRSRYMFAGDMRTCHAYGGQNPCAIIIAPVGRAADYDLNLADTAAAAYTADASFMRFDIDSAGVGTLTLVQADRTTATNTLTIALANYNTLQELVDYINSTSFSANGQQWRAQLCPGANPEAVPLTALTPHNRTLTACITAGGSPTITRNAGGLGNIAVGMRIVAGGNIDAGTYVTRINSDSSITINQNAAGSSGANTLVFYFELGDEPTVALANTGYQRVISNSLPGFLYFNPSYLNAAPLDKQAVWMTVASPGSVKSAPNCFSNKFSNKHTPPLDSGICMGGGAVDQGFVVLYANKVGAIRNTRDSGSGLDEDYRLYITNESRGCVAWNTVCQGNRFVPFMSAEGMCAADLYGDLLLSADIYRHPPSDTSTTSPTGVGDFAYEITQCVAAAAKDDDTAYANARVMRSALWVSYRASSAVTHPNRQVVYDFSADKEITGLEALKRDKGGLWGWSLPLARPAAAMCEARRDDGLHLYAWYDGITGGTGGGRIDEMESSADTDNGTAIGSASVQMPWERPPSRSLISAQEFTLEHVSPSGSTGSFVFHRSFSDDQYTLTPGTSSLVQLREVKLLSQAARVGANACYLEYKQATGAARELRKITLRAKILPSYT